MSILRITRWSTQQGSQTQQQTNCLLAQRGPGANMQHRVTSCVHETVTAQKGAPSHLSQSGCCGRRRQGSTRPRYSGTPSARRLHQAVEARLADSAHYDQATSIRGSCNCKKIARGEGIQVDRAVRGVWQRTERGAPARSSFAAVGGQRA